MLLWIQDILPRTVMAVMIFLNSIQPCQLLRPARNNRFYEPGSVDLDTTTLQYEWDLGDGTKIRDLQADHCFKGPGDYVIKLNVIDTLTGEIYFNQASYDLKVEDIQQPYITTVDTCSV